MAEDVFEADADLAEWVRQACDAARGVVTAGLVGSGDAARDEALKALQEEVRQLRNREPSMVLDDGAAAKEIAQLKAEVASLRRPSVEVGAELLGKYSGDGNWYDVIVEAVTADGLISASGGAAVPSRHLHESSPGEEVVGGLFFDFEPIRTASRPRFAQVPACASATTATPRTCRCRICERRATTAMQ
jgi:hypothetical protein